MPGGFWCALARRFRCTVPCWQSVLFEGQSEALTQADLGARMPAIDQIRWQLPAKPRRQLLRWMFSFPDLQTSQWPRGQKQIFHCPPHGVARMGLGGTSGRLLITIGATGDDQVNAERNRKGTRLELKAILKDEDCQRRRLRSNVELPKNQRQTPRSRI